MMAWLHCFELIARENDMGERSCVLKQICSFYGGQEAKGERKKETRSQAPISLSGHFQ
jgi:hypothetical protein